MNEEKHYTDPYADREKEKYDNPVPSREAIQELIKDQGHGLSRDQVISFFQLHNDNQLEGIRRRLKAMERDGQLIWIKGHYHLIDAFPPINGIISAHPDGFGFLLAEDGGEDVFLPHKEMQQVFHEDIATVRITGIDNKGRRQGVIVEVLERNTHKITGIYTSVSGTPMVMADHKKINHDILIDYNDKTEVQEGQVIVVEITDYPGRFSKTKGRIVQVLGDHMQPGQEIDVSVRIHDIPHDWPDAVLAETENFKQEPEPHDKENRLDIRHLPLVTIDGEDAKDFDDAVYVQKNDQGWNLKVAIADVSAYVKPGTELDKEALNRGTSVYFPGRVVPMLPEVLSNGLCSLKPQVDRLCLLCDIQFNSDGDVIRYQFHEAVMKSAARLTYDRVAELIDQPELAVDEETDLLPSIHELYHLFQQLNEKRQQRGAIDFETDETRIIFSDNKKIEKIVPVYRNDAHKIIEECMLAANVCAADYLIKKDLPVLFRNHEGPNIEKLTDLRAFLSLLSLTLKGGDDPSAADYAELLNKVKERIDAPMIQTSMLRSLSQAMYEAENKGHFGLSYEHYTHFTSPIRRYPDLLIHRAIKKCINQQSEYSYQKEQMISLGEHCSMVERRADEATRDVVDWLKCEYMLDKVGETFDGIISTVTGFGFFVRILDIHVEGLVHVTSLKHDYYAYNKPRHELTGERTGKRFKLGQKVSIKIASVSLDERKIDLFIADDDPIKKKTVKKDQQAVSSAPQLKEKKEIQTVQKKKKSKRRGRKTTFKRRL